MGQEEIESNEVTVNVKAFMTMNLYIQSAQLNIGRTILVTDSESETGPDGPAEIFRGVDGETGVTMEIRVSYPST